MSADLFAEFGGEPSSNPQPQPSTLIKPAPPRVGNLGLFEELSTGIPAPSPAGQTRPNPLLQQLGAGPAKDFFNSHASSIVNDDHDDWGDFEGGPTIETNLSHEPDSAQPQPLPHSWGTRSSLKASFSNGFQQPAPSAWQSAPIMKAKQPTDSNVLFDAEDSINDDDDDDDFGKFEGTENMPSATSAVKASSALDEMLGGNSISGQIMTAPQLKSTKRFGGGTAGNFGKVTKSDVPQPSLESQKPKEEDAWDSFEDWEVSDAKQGANKASNSQVLEPLPRMISSAMAASEPRRDELPPTNVPPPGVLLSLFPSFFTEAQEKLFKPMASQALPMRNKLMAEATTIEYLQGYLLLANVAAHVIAGRKLRWKRDQHLSQGMRIGPASSRATSGMKLTGIDKGENIKEEREVSDVVRVWKEQVGRLRHVVAGINQIKAGTLGTVAELHEVMAVKSLKQSEGGIPARQACMLCGLKRDERVTAMDLAANDSFGEWWLDQVKMHRDCRNFWEQHKDALRQR